MSPVPAEGLAADSEVAPASARDEDTLFVELVTGEAESLDPAWTYESQGMGLVANLYDTLVAFERERADRFVAALADQWFVSPDGRSYNFTLRDGVTFHEGGSLEAHDAAYSLQRAMLQERSGGPTWLLLQPILGVASLSELAVSQGAGTTGDTPPAVADLSDAEAEAVCEAVLEAVTADDELANVTITLAEPSPWFLQIVAHWISSVVDREWLVEQGDWDGDCASWRDWHDPSAEATALFDRANGTGPYRLASWKKGEEIRLQAYPDYWRQDPAWIDGPTGPARIDTVVVQTVVEWGARYIKLATGEADRAVVPLSEAGQLESLVHTVYEGGDDLAPATVVNERGALKLFQAFDTVSADAALFNRAIEVAGGNDFVGSGQLDGEGIPPNFFADADVRRGFGYCFDWSSYLEEALNGDGRRMRGPIIAGLQGYDESSPVPEYDLDRCAEALASAWDGQLPDVGFHMRVAYDEGNLGRRAAAEILADGLASVNPSYRLEAVALQWPSLLEHMTARRLPITFAGWFEDYHDASNWTFAFLHSGGAYGQLMGWPAERAQEMDERVMAAMVEVNADRRDALFRELQISAAEDATALFLHQWQGRSYLRRGVDGWYAHPLMPLAGAPYYHLSKSP